MTQARPSRPEGGFTIMEITVGIVLLGLLLSGIYTVAIGTLKAKMKIDQLAAVNTAGPKILELVEMDLRGAYMHNVKDSKGLKAQRQSIGGTEVTLLDLITTTNSRLAEEVDDRMVRSDVTEIGYRLRRSDDLPGMLELYRREEFFFDDDPLKGGRYYLVYDRVRSFVIDFYAPPEDSTTSSIAKEEGVEQWDSEEEKVLPMAAKITLELGPPEEMTSDLENDERSYRFVRWVLFPTAYDAKPEEQDSGPADGSGQPGGGGGGGGGR